jgi:hypothetical protein
MTELIEIGFGLFILWIAYQLVQVIDYNDKEINK